MSRALALHFWDFRLSSESHQAVGAAIPLGHIARLLVQAGLSTKGLAIQRRVINTLEKAGDTPAVKGELCSQRVSFCANAVTIIEGAGGNPFDEPLAQEANKNLVEALREEEAGAELPPGTNLKAELHRLHGLLCLEARDTTGALKNLEKALAENPALDQRAEIERAILRCALQRNGASSKVEGGFRALLSRPLSPSAKVQTLLELSDSLLLALQPEKALAALNEAGKLLSDRALTAAFSTSVDDAKEVATALQGALKERKAAFDALGPLKAQAEALDLQQSLAMLKDTPVPVHIHGVERDEKGKALERVVNALVLTNDTTRLSITLLMFAARTSEASSRLPDALTAWAAAAEALDARSSIRGAKECADRALALGRSVVDRTPSDLPVLDYIAALNVAIRSRCYSSNWAEEGLKCLKEGLGLDGLCPQMLDEISETASESPAVRGLLTLLQREKIDVSNIKEMLGIDKEETEDEDEEGILSLVPPDFETQLVHPNSLAPEDYDALRSLCGLSPTVIIPSQRPRKTQKTPEVLQDDESSSSSSFLTIDDDDDNGNGNDDDETKDENESEDKNQQYREKE